MQLSYSSAVDLATIYPQYASQITAAAQSSFLAGDQLAYLAGLVAVVIGAVLVFFFFPKKEDEERARQSYVAEDSAAAPEATKVGTVAGAPA